MGLLTINYKLEFNELMKCLFEDTFMKVVAVGLHVNEPVNPKNKGPFLSECVCENEQPIFKIQFL